MVTIVAKKTNIGGSWSNSRNIQSVKKRLCKQYRNSKRAQGGVLLTHLNELDLERIAK